ncbi:unnamed protein product [Blepharisma stoltei]|uniref:Uncharacterized protein n=1 Tax=Blepharisma stoltei TaxID=1481888 RepID=A0AAU9JYY6_9CILI|nr:unnamed protein product [Blepharisma stoltei]
MNPGMFKVQIIWVKQLRLGDTPQWTTIPGAKWIWKSVFVEYPESGESYMFQKEFNVNGSPTQSLLSIAGDNSYTLIFNGNFIVATQFWNEGMAQTYGLISRTVQGRNVVQVVVTNYARENKDIYTNPGGLLFKLKLTWLNI